MAPRLALDDRLWNPYAVENLEQTHPERTRAISVHTSEGERLGYFALAE